MRLILASYDYNKTITILVGPEERSFVAHQDALCANSKFFRAACSKRWLEGQEKTLHLPEVRSEAAFQTYVNWAYTNELVLAKSVAANESTIYNNLVEIWLLGDFLDDVKFRNEALRLLHTHTIEAKSLLDYENYHIIWDRTLPRSLLRAWAVDSFIAMVSRDWFSKHANLFPAEFVSAVATHAIPRVATEYRGEEGLGKRFADYIEPDADA